jgi:uncharacterized protein (TIGR02594 family)
MAFIFGGDTGDTPESIARKRALADALMRQPAPTDMWSGINSASGKIAGALIARNAGRREDEQRSKASEAFLAALGMGGQTAPAASGMPAPQVPEAAPVAAPQSPPVVEPLNFDPARVANAIESPSPQRMAHPSQGPSSVIPPASPPTVATAVQVQTGADPMAVAETLIGRGEVPDREMIQEYLETGGAGMDPATQAWCAAFVNATLAKTGVEGTGSPAARSFMNWGEGVDAPRRGDVAVFSRGDPNGWQGHVGFFDRMNDDGSVRVLGGNQGDAVSYEDFSADRLLGFRRAAQPAGSQPTGAQPADGRRAVAQALASAQPQQPQAVAGGINPALLQALANPFMDEGQRAVLSALVQQQMSGGGEPKRYTVGGSLVDASGNVLFSEPEEAEPGYRMMTPQEVAQDPRLDPNKPYQVGPRGQISAVGGGGVTVNTGDTADNSLSKRLAVGQADMFTGTAKGGVDARAELSQIDELETLLAEGIGGNLDAFKVAMRDRFGIDIGMGGPVEAFTALINRLIPMQRQEGSGPMSDKDIDMFKASLPQLVNSPEGNRLILDTMRAMAQFKRRQGEIANAVINGRMTREEGLDALYDIPDILAPIRERRERVEAARRELEGLE